MLYRYDQGNTELPGFRLRSILFRLGLQQCVRVCSGCLLVALSVPTYAAQTTATVRNTSGAESSAPIHKVIDKIYINIGDVFDIDNPKENNTLFRFANKMHINTRESVIRDLVLFKPGDVLSLQKLAESERILRSQDFLYDAVIRPTNIRPDKVDIQIYTRDVWTLTGGVSFSREGGKNSSSFELEESNFLGYGKQLTIRNKAGVERTEHTYKYHDSALLGTRHNLTLEHSENSDGRRSVLGVLRPFFALGTRKSYGFSWLKEDRIDSELQNLLVYQNRHRDDFWESFIGVSQRLAKNKTIRFKYGYTYDQHRYNPINRADDAFVPDDIRDSYPWVELSYLEDKFIKTHRIHYLHKTEDINLGHDASFRIGWTGENLGSLRNGVILKGRYQYNAIIHKGALLSHAFKVGGRIIDDRWVDGVVGSETQYHFKKTPSQNNYVSLQLEYGRELSKENELVLGGDTGLRGYPLDLQRGNNRFLLTYERRFYTDWHIMQLVYVGSVIFFDVGRAWDTGETYSNNQGVLKDIGFGLRLASSRSGKNLVFHLDVSLPLDGNDSFSEYEVTAKSASKF